MTGDKSQASKQAYPGLLELCSSAVRLRVSKAPVDAALARAMDSQSMP